MSWKGRNDVDGGEVGRDSLVSSQATHTIESRVDMHTYAERMRFVTAARRDGRTVLTLLTLLTAVYTWYTGI